MTKRLTNKQLSENIARAHGCAQATLPGDALRGILEELREGRVFRASVYEAAGMPELPGYTLTAKDDAELFRYIENLRNPAESEAT
jgi:hypothetical protein